MTDEPKPGDKASGGSTRPSENSSWDEPIWDEVDWGDEDEAKPENPARDFRYFIVTQEREPGGQWRTVVESPIPYELIIDMLFRENADAFIALDVMSKSAVLTRVLSGIAPAEAVSAVQAKGRAH